MSTINLLRILIIDDNPQIHKDFIKILAIEELSETRKKLNELEKDIFSDKAKIKKTALPEFLIDTASQGQEGVEKITKAMAEGNPYALAFVDVRMPPGWDGVETIKHIWEIDPDIQVVICSAYSDYSWEETVENLGSRENLLILKKPFDNIAVRQLSCALTKKWQMLQELNLNTLSLEERVKERTKSLQQSLAITRGTLESSADGILVINYDDVIIDYNKKFLDMWNISASLIESKDANKILEHIADQVRDTQDFLAIINKIRKKSDIIKIEKLKTKDGKIFEYYSQPYSLNDKVSGYICSFHDITKRIMLEEDFEHQSTHDVLTGLPNRVLLVDRINQAIGIADEHKSEFGIIFLDLDRFKLINDSLSHAAGDEVLKEVGRRLTSSIRKEDTCARLGGDEFVLVVGIDTPFYMTRICSELIEVFKQPFKVGGREVTITTSMGISIYPAEGNNPDKLLSNADIAMYRSKELGKNQFQFYTLELGKKSSEHLAKEEELRQALINNEFFLVYQPQMNILTSKISSVEALIRWQHPTKGLIAPIDFIPLAEEMGLINEIGKWVLIEACKQNVEWQKLGLTKIRVAVNIANDQLHQPDFVATVKSTLLNTGLKPDYLELELTENVVVKNPAAIASLTELHDMGVNISLDDFGTGTSCMNYLRTLSINSIKLDQSFIRNIHVNKSDDAILQAIISMAQSLDLKIVAEGVETQNQLDFLKSHNCGEVQGYYFSKPLSNVELENFLKE